MSAEPDDFILMERFRDRSHKGWTLRFKCPACLQTWSHPRGLRRHMAVLHHRCRFCVKAYIRIDRHERLAHTDEWARANGACGPKGEPG